MLTTNGSSKILMMSVITIHCKEKCCKDIDVSGSIPLTLWVREESSIYKSVGI